MPVGLRKALEAAGVLLDERALGPWGSPEELQEGPGGEEGWPEDDVPFEVSARVRPVSASRVWKYGNWCTLAGPQ